MNPFSIEQGWELAKQGYPPEHHDMLRHCFFGGATWGARCLLAPGSENVADVHNNADRIKEEIVNAKFNYKPTKPKEPFHQYN